MLGREGPFPLILLPQFGGYWIEGTNHQLSGAPDSPPTPVPGTRAKLEGNHTAKIYRKHFLGKVRPWGLQVQGLGWGMPHGFGWAGAWGPQIRVFLEVGVVSMGMGVPRAMTWGLVDVGMATVLGVGSPWEWKDMETS